MRSKAKAKDLSHTHQKYCKQMPMGVLTNQAPRFASASCARHGQEQKIAELLKNENHVHDLAKFMFGFTVSWAYIAFSQFMLIWYANLPEETLFFEHRMRGSWAVVSVLLIVLKFIVPFLALLPRWAKRDFNFLTIISLLILITQVLDLHWLIYPNFNEHHVLFSLWDILIFGGFLGLFGLSVTHFLSQNSLIPKHDPFLQESADHEIHYG